MRLCSGVVLGKTKDGVWIQTANGGKVKGPTAEKFRIGEHVDYLVGGAEIVLNVFKAGCGLHIMNPLPSYDINILPGGEDGFWESYIPPIELLGLLV